MDPVAACPDMESLQNYITGHKTIKKKHRERKKKKKGDRALKLFVEKTVYCHVAQFQSKVTQPVEKCGSLHRKGVLY